MVENFICPECESNNVKSKFKRNNKLSSRLYKNVYEEIQCGSCFFDIPSELCLMTSKLSLEDKKNNWHNIYKPEHLKLCAKCSKCNNYYWEIEKKLDRNGLNNGDIFYQIFKINGEEEKLICKLCDPKAFV